MLTPTIKLSPKQWELLKALQSKKYKYLLYGGSFAGGKSYLGAFIITAFALDYPVSRYAVVRKNLTTLKRTTLKTFLKLFADIGIKPQFNQSSLTFTFKNGSTIEFIEADESKDFDFNKLKGLELTACMIDEANEIHETAFNILTTRIGRWNYHNEFAFIFLTCNPDQNWVKSRFYDPFSDNKLEAPYFFLQALPKHNPFLSKDYMESLEYLPEAEYQRYVLGDWNYSDDPNQLIRYEWIKENLVELIKDVNPTNIGVDVAREGNDRTVFAYRKNDTLIRLEVFKMQDTIQTAKLLQERVKEYGVGYRNISVDSIGVGAGVVDYLKHQGMFVREYISGSRPNSEGDRFKYKNKRAESYWQFREKLQRNEIKLINNADLIRELLNMKYFVKDRYIQIESKEEIKSRLGFSTDLSDATVICFEETPQTYTARYDKKQSGTYGVESGSTTFEEIDKMIKGSLGRR